MSRYEKGSTNNKALEELNGAGISAPQLLVEEGQSIESVVNLEISEAAQEAFMNEMVEVTLASTTNENDAPHITFNVNGRNQTFFRDTPIRCRRMFLEVLARCKETKYTQRTDPHDITRSELIPRTVFAYPFSVVDENPKGRAWLNAVKAEAN